MVRAGIRVDWHQTCFIASKKKLLLVFRVMMVVVVIVLVRPFGVGHGSHEDRGCSTLIVDVREERSVGFTSYLTILQRRDTNNGD